MGKFQDLTGKVFNNLLVLERVSTTSYKKTCWKCKCNCGNLVNVTSTHLKSGNTTSCGCTKKEKIREANTSHGLSKHPLYSVWNDMMKRCYNKNSINYSHYGERGITVDIYYHNPANFIQDTELLWKPGLYLDRIDTNKHYTKDNIRFISAKESTINRRVTINVEGHYLRDYCKKFNLNYNTILSRITKSKWPINKAISTPIRHRNPQ